MLLESLVFVGVISVASFAGAALATWMTSGSETEEKVMTTVKTEVHGMHQEQSTTSIAEIALLIVLIVLVTVLIAMFVVAYRKFIMKKKASNRDIEMQSIRNNH